MTTARDFEFDRIEAFVNRHQATVLALQFPLQLLKEAPAVATALAARLGATPFLPAICCGFFPCTRWPTSI